MTASVPEWTDILYLGQERKDPIYTRTEADRIGISYRYWRKARPGEWGLTDDEYATECLERNEYDTPLSPGLIRVHLIFTCGRPWSTQRRFDWEPRRSDRYSWYTAEKTNTARQKLGRARPRFCIQMYVMLMVERGMRLKDSDWVTLGRIYYPQDPRKGMRYFRKLLRKPEAIAMAAEMMRKVMSTNGLTLEWIEQEYMDLHKIAKEKAREVDTTEHLIFARQVLIDLRELAEGTTIPFGFGTNPNLNTLQGATHEYEEAKLLPLPEKAPTGHGSEQLSPEDIPHLDPNGTAPDAG